MTIRCVKIYGERCSGTNYLEELISLNFDVQLLDNQEYGWKHFFGHTDLTNTDDILFICIVRELHSWINSFFRVMHHLLLKYESICYDLSNDVKIYKFLNDEFYSIEYKDKNVYEIIADRNIYTKQRYKNIFELRHIKNKFIIKDLPNIVTNYVLIRYEDLLNNFENTMNKFKKKGLKLKSNLSQFPINSKLYKRQPNTEYTLVKQTKIDFIPKHMVYDHPDFNDEYEKILKYI